MKKIIIRAIASAGILSFTGCAEHEPQTTTTTTEETTVHRPDVNATTTTETQSVRPAASY